MVPEAGHLETGMGQVGCGRGTWAGLQCWHLDFPAAPAASQGTVWLAVIQPVEKVIFRWDRQRARRQMRKPIQEAGTQTISDRKRSGVTSRQNQDDKWQVWCGDEGEEGAGMTRVSCRAGGVAIYQDGECHKEG